MSIEQLEKLVVQLSAKLMATEEKLNTSANSESYWFKEYTKIRNELAALNNNQEVANG